MRMQPAAAPYTPGAPCHRCGRCVPVGRQEHEPVRVLVAGRTGGKGRPPVPAAWVVQERTVCRAGDREGCRG